MADLENNQSAFYIPGWTKDFIFLTSEESRDNAALVELLSTSTQQLDFISLGISDGNLYNKEFASLIESFKIDQLSNKLILKPLKEDDNIDIKNKDLSKETEKQVQFKINDEHLFKEIDNKVLSNIKLLSKYA